MKSLVVFGIDVSSRQSTVAVVINRAKLPEFKISNDLIGFKRLGKELELYHITSHKLSLKLPAFIPGDCKLFWNGIIMIISE